MIGREKPRPRWQHLSQNNWQRRQLPRQSPTAPPASRPPAEALRDRPAHSEGAVEAPVGRWSGAGYGAHGPLQLLERSSTTGTPFPIRSASALAISRFSLIRLLLCGRSRGAL
jgi:hypothetical protein